LIGLVDVVRRKRPAVTYRFEHCRVLTTTAKPVFITMVKAR
jgi:hypothetical protein